MSRQPDRDEEYSKMLKLMFYVDHRRGAEKNSQTHTVSKEEEITVQLHVLLVTSCTEGAAEEAPTPPPPPPRHTLGTGHGQYWIYLVHEGRRMEGRIHTRIESKKK